MKTFYRVENGKATSIFAEEAFPFLKEKKHTISLVGGGGKTSLMYVLAEQSAHYLDKVLIYTTTHIQKPDTSMYAESIEELESLWTNQKVVVIGESEIAVKPGNTEMNEEKIKEPRKSLLGYAKDEADICFIEADGAKRLPIKVPAAHEPVISETSDIVIGVVGISCYGKNLTDVCFRTEEAQRLFHKNAADVFETDFCLEEEQIAQILLSEQGTRKNVGKREYYIVLNQCDTAEDLQKAIKVQKILSQQGFSNVLLSGRK